MQHTGRCETRACVQERQPLEGGRRPGACVQERRPLEGGRRCVWISVLWLLQQITANGGSGAGLGGLDAAEMGRLRFWRPRVWDQGAGRASLLLELSGRVPRRLVSGGSGCALSASAPPSARPLPSMSSVHLLKGCWLLTSEPTLNPGRSSQLQILHQTCKDSLQIRSHDRTPGVKMWTQTLQPSFTLTQWCPENALPLIFQIQPPSL